MKKQRAAKGSQYVMLGRVVTHHSLASLASYGPRTINVREQEPLPDAFADMPSAKIAMGKSSSATDAKAYAKIGAAVGSYFRDKEWGTATQSPGYQEYRRGERQAY